MVGVGVGVWVCGGGGRGSCDIFISVDQIKMEQGWGHFLQI
jgi:hypothetical protein